MNALVSGINRSRGQNDCCHGSSSSFHRTRNKKKAEQQPADRRQRNGHTALHFKDLFSVFRFLRNNTKYREIFTMNQYPGRIQSILEDRRTSAMIDHEFPRRKIQTSSPSSIGATAQQESLIPKEYEILRICQALLLSTCMLLLSYHSIRYGRTEYSILANGKIAQGYAHKAVVTLSLGYSVPYSVISFLAIGMLAYSIVSKRPRWSIPSIILYLVDLVYDVSGAFIVIWLLFSHLPGPMAFSYTIGTILLILGEVWIWLGVLRLYEQRTFK